MGTGRQPFRGERGESGLAGRGEITLFGSAADGRRTTRWETDRNYITPPRFVPLPLKTSIPCSVNKSTVVLDNIMSFQ